MSAVTKIEIYQKHKEISLILEKHNLKISLVFGYGRICNEHYGANADLNLFIEEDLSRETLNDLKQDLCTIFNKKIDIDTSDSLTTKTQNLYNINFKLLPETIDKIKQAKVSLEELLEDGKNQYELVESLSTEIISAEFPNNLPDTSISQLSPIHRKVLIKLGKIYGDIAKYEHSDNHPLAYLGKFKEINEVIAYAKNWNIHWACVENKIEIVKCILQYDPEQINFQETKFGNTALHIASHTKNATLINLLLENGAKDNIENNNKKTANQVAADKGINLSKSVQKTSFFTTSSQNSNHNFAEEDESPKLIVK